ncbi:MAG: nodulation protein NfeD, partial [Muribaculaceae bacterium]|nr:nodulation protein NfeD [Muribaculaceae bacterium]
LLLNASPRAVVLTIDDEIDASAWRHTRRAIEEMHTLPGGADFFILRLNTYGGAVDMADSIRTALLRLDVPTAVYIDHNAASAGALISLACDTIIMAPHATIGAATVVNGSGEPMPVKYQSYWSSIMRATAMAHGRFTPPGDSVERWRRNPEIAMDMVNPEKAISLTAREAVDCGIADGIAATFDDALQLMGFADAELVPFKPTFTDSLLGFLASAGVRAILITLILGGIYMEMHTPGLGVAAGVAIVAAILDFLPMIVTGSMAPWVVVLFILGIVLIALEVFVIPGFGITGISGIVCIIASLLGAMLGREALGGIDFSGLGHACVTLVAGIALAAAGAWFLTSRFGPARFRRATTLDHSQRTEDGYIGVDSSLADLKGQLGNAVTDLRPAGKVKIGDTTCDAVSRDGFIEAGSEIKVVAFETAQVYVEKV